MEPSIGKTSCAVTPFFGSLRGRNCESSQGRSLAGAIVRLAADEITIRRQDPALGVIVVHFPRAGYRIVKQ